MVLSPGRSRTKLIHAVFVRCALSYLQNLIVFARNSRRMKPLRLLRPILPLVLAPFVVVCPGLASAQMPSTIDLANGEEDVTIYGGSAGDFLPSGSAAGGSILGTLMATGDLNGDGVADMVLGSSAASGLSVGTEAGAAYIYFGSSSLAGTKDIAGIAGTAPDVTIYGANANDILTNGDAIKVGDLNGDGIDDLILGALGADGPSEARTDAGEAYVILGSSNLPSIIDLAKGEEDVIIYGATAGDKLTDEDGFYAAIEMGDLNGDGIDDLILGASRADGPAEARNVAGEAYVIFGSSSLPATIDLASSDEDVTIYGATEGDLMTQGGVLTVGDLDGDGFGDLILGAPQADGPSEHTRARRRGICHPRFGESPGDDRPEYERRRRDDLRRHVQRLSPLG